MSPALQGVVVLLAVMVPVTVLLVWLFATRVFVWKRLECNFFDVKYVAPPGYSTAKLAEALHVVSDALAQHVPEWSAGRIAESISGCRILVASVYQWQNMSGQWVGGEQDGNIVKVGVNLAALCHEVAHLCEMHIEGSYDYDHAHWARKGIWAADNVYSAWLSASGPLPTL